MASEGEHVADADVAQKLINAAEEALEIKPQSSVAEDAPAKEHSAASEYTQNVAHIVLDKGNLAADSSTAYIETVVHKVQDYTQNAASGSSSDIPETISKAVHVGARPGEGDPSAGRGGGLLTSVATWFSSLCGSKSIAAGGSPRSVDPRAAAKNVAEVLHSSTTTTSSSVATPSPHAVLRAETSAPVAPAAECSLAGATSEVVSET